MKMLSMLSVVAIMLVTGYGNVQATGLRQAYDGRIAYAFAPLSSGTAPSTFLASDPLAHAGLYASSESAQPQMDDMRTVPASEGKQSRGMHLNVHDYGGVRYISGGIGYGEIERLKTMSDQFNLRLQFAMYGSGEYLADIDVRILNVHGDAILITTSRGPWLLAELRPGDYSVEVRSYEYKSQPSPQIVHINDSKQHQLNFYWR